jgi:RNA polymerase sigma factor (sigma-70 family)
MMDKKSDEKHEESYERARAALRKSGVEDDYLHDAFLKLLKLKLLTSEDQAGRIMNLKAYLVRSAQNFRNNYFKRKQRHLEWVADLKSRTELDSGASPEEHWAREQLWTDVIATLDASVGVLHRMAFMLRVQEGLSYKEIGRELKISPRAAESYVGRCKRRLGDIQEQQP